MLAAALVMLLAAYAAGASADPARYVDPFIGTGGHGHTYPGATLPFGMVQLSPDTRLTGWDGCSGYHDSDRVIYGFSHTHLSGTGIPDYGDILLMPITGAPRMENGEGGAAGAGYASRFDKSTERAEPGWYAVTLADSGIAVELTATERTGWHRYRFPVGAPGHVVIDLRHRDKLLDWSLRAVGDREIEGHRRSTGWAKDQVVYFVARLSRPFRIAGAEGRQQTSSAPEVPAAVLSFGDAGGELLVKVGISAVDIEGARRNLEAEAPGWDFDAVRRAARVRWNAALSRVEVEGGTAEQRAIFYTSLFHALLVPNVYSDVDGRYRGMDRQVHQARGRAQYTVFSLWDTFRAEHPLLTILEPRRTRDFLETFLAQYREGGRLPVWELAANETDTMIGYHSVPVIADAWLKGVRGLDAKLAGSALDAMLHSAGPAGERDAPGLAAYRRQGFIGGEDASESVSRTLEYGYDDYCIARMAASLGRDDVAREFARRSQAWRHLLDPATGFMRPRRAQRWLEPFDPRRVDNNYTEANAWQYSFFVPHDVPGLIEALGGDDAFVARLDELFDADSATTGREQADITGLIGQYAHGNEPSHHMAWLYHYAGRPDRSAERVRRILAEMYHAAPDGLAGNEDCGQMSSWYVLAAIGLYPVCPCTDQYLLTPPLFDKVTLHLDQGRTFTIAAGGAGGQRAYITGAALNGAPLARSYLRHEEIARGGTLALTLGAAPASGWGAAAAGRPGLPLDGDRVVPAPYVAAGGERFRDRTEVMLGCATPGATIRYRLDTASTDAWTIYSGPFELQSSARLSLVAESDGRRSPVLEAPFLRLPNDWGIEVATPPNAQYTAGGDDALIDGVRGPRDWRRGGWQGYQGTDFEATIDLRRPRPIHHAGASFLQDMGSWIWMPREVIVSVSADGREFRQVGRLPSGASDREEGVILRDLVVTLGGSDGIEARYVRMRATNYGAIPDWHPGRGGQAFIFVDEVLID